MDNVSNQDAPGETSGQRTLGDKTEVTFPDLGGGVKVKAKIDSGATTSSLHAEHIQVNGDQVTFASSALGNRRFTMSLVGNQDVRSADGGEKQRPMIKLNIELGGQQLSGVAFNLNDRSGMDSPVLIGQNVLRAGNFVIDVSKSPPDQGSPEQTQQGPTEQQILDALNILREANMSLSDLFEYIRTDVVRNLKD